MDGQWISFRLRLGTSGLTLPDIIEVCDLWQDEESLQKTKFIFMPSVLTTKSGLASVWILLCLRFKNKLILRIA